VRYAGFMIVGMEDERPSQEDEPYVGAFVPLEVAQQYPDLLVRETLDHEEILSEEKLPRGTRMVVAPGRFKQIRTSPGCFGVVLMFAAGLGALAARV
jgi:hypothetical protein